MRMDNLSVGLIIGLAFIGVALVIAKIALIAGLAYLIWQWAT